MERINKSQFIARIASMSARIAENDPHVKPCKGTDSGSLGKLYEASVKAFFGNVRGATVTRQGAVDTRFHGYAVEIKQGASGLDMIFDGHVVDYVVYCPDFQIGDDVARVSYVLTRDGFVDALEQAGMVRTKRGSDGIERKAMQSYKNSNKKYNAWLDALDEFAAMTLGEFKEIERKGAEG